MSTVWLPFGTSSAGLVSAYASGRAAVGRPVSCSTSTAANLFEIGCAIAQVADAAEGNDLPHLEGMCNIKRTGWRQLTAAGEPLHQMAAGRVAHGNQALRIEMMSGRVGDQQVQSRGRVLIGAGIAAALPRRFDGTRRSRRRYRVQVNAPARLRICTMP
jgi:hypothetical protein